MNDERLGRSLFGADPDDARRPDGPPDEGDGDHADGDRRDRLEGHDGPFGTGPSHTDGPASRPGTDHPHEPDDRRDPYPQDPHDADSHDPDGPDGHDPDGARVIGDPGRPRRAKPAGRRLLVIALALLLVIGGGALGWSVFGPAIGQLVASNDFEGPGSGSVQVVVEPGDTGRDIATTLQQAGVVKTAEAFEEALTDNPGDEIQPGHYTLRQQMPAVEALSAMRQGARTVVQVTVREGLWKSEVFDVLAEATGRPRSEYEAADRAIRANPSLVGLPSSAGGNIEGYLFPATYSFDPGTGALAQLRQLVQNATDQLRSLGVSEADAERIITIASLVEAEARLDADRPRVARVIYNRLAAGMPLQFDSTVAYGMQRRTLTTTDRERAATNPYNTYAQPGLPAGPINSPGAESITAAQNPAEGTWMYFVTINPETGETRFSTTLAEHNQHVRVFQQWCQANPGKC